MNDDCAQAIPITGQGLFSFDNTDALTDGGLDCRVFSDIWFCWTSPCSGDVTVDTCGTTTVNTQLEVLSGCNCETATSLVCEELDPPPSRPELCGFQSRASFTAVDGESYLIRLGIQGGIGLTGGTGSFTVQCAGPPEALPELPPENCRAPDAFTALSSNRTEFIAATRFSVAVEQSIDQLRWWGTYFDGTTDCYQSAPDAFEVRYYLDAGGIPGALVGGPFAQNVGTLTATGPSRTGRFLFWGSHEYVYDAAHAPVLLEADRCYWVEVTNQLLGDCNWHWSTTYAGAGRTVRDGDEFFGPDGYDFTDNTTGQTAFCLNTGLVDPQGCAPPPLNDDCAASTFVSNGVTWFDTFEATTDGDTFDNSAGCSPELEPCCRLPLGDGQIHKDIWFDYVATCIGVMTATVDGSFFDPKLAVYEGPACPGSTNPLWCSDDVGGSGLRDDSRVAFPVTAGETFKIRVGGFRGDAGPGTLEIRCGSPPTNDECVDAVIEELPFRVEGGNFHATSDCELLGNDEVWIVFDLQEEQSVTVEYCGSTPLFEHASDDLALECPCEDLFVQGRLDMCQDGNPLLTWSCLAPGRYYYPVFSEPGSEGMYDIAVSSAPCLNACQDGAGDCLSNHGGRGCDDPICCGSVCSFDPHCCEESWDEYCAILAVQLCAATPTDICATMAEGDCFFPHDTPGCEDPDICNRVCDCDPFCCVFEWDLHCAGLGFPPNTGCGGAMDCNANGIPDGDELYELGDCNNNQLPDECDPASGGDFNGDGVADLGDLNAFTDCMDGPDELPQPNPPQCLAQCLNAFDVNGDEKIDLSDFAGF
ncbi:MAG: hypothetical protein IID43_06780, partial [Planctomycetes bacterium]|nr:hypothetical protein [Planctomycetota bacterium]